MNITKVIFTPKRRAPVNCSNAEYFVNTIDWDEAINKAAAQFKRDNKLWSYYGDAIAITVKVL